MKYFLAVDKGLFEKYDKRYLLLNLNLNDSIDRSLNHNNNLKELCIFTRTFLDEIQLKNFLIKKGVLLKEYKHWNLKIVYKYKYGEKIIIKSLDIPYKNDEKYFKFENLAMIIKNRIWNSPEFLNVFVRYFENDIYKTEEFYELRDFEVGHMSENVLYDSVRAFISARCTDRKGKLNFRKFYDVSMFMAKADSKEVLEKKNDVNLGVNLDNLNEGQRFKLEEWQDRMKKKDNQERQLKLF